MSKPAGRHRDAFGRQTIVEQEDAAREMYIRPSDGRLASLVVQGSNENDLKSSSAGWIRMGQMRRQVSPIIDLVHWTYSSVSVEGSEERHYDGAGTLSLLLKWVPSCIVLVIMLLIPQDLEGNKRNGGFYDPVRYRDWGYSKVSRNAAENSSQELEEAEEPQDDVPLLADDIEMSSVSHHVQISDRHSELETEFDDDFDDLPARQFRPRYLCFLHQDPNGAYHCQTRGVTDFMREHEDSAATDFIFLSYTRKQFCVATEKELATWDLPDAETRRAYGLAAIQDRQTLLKYGIKAALSAGKSAFWLDFECIRDGDNEAKAQSQSEDVYRICDIVRAAHSLAILLGPPISSKLPSGVRQSYDSNHVKLWLHEWGTRLWTLPEILLCSSEHRITIYAIGGPSQPEQLAKRNFAGRAWKDSRLVRQLVDHYEASVHLTPLELVSIALECFSSRQTDQFHDGDIAYALMGLLRRRPAVNKSDTSFEAFARLSLANDSDNLLERLLCMLPVHPDAPWHEIKDAWGARLWDIEPRCQIAGIVDDQTVTLDGAFGATIQWDSTEQVAFFKRSTLIRTLGKILLRGVPAYLIFALVFTITGGVLLQNYNNQTKQSGNDGDNDDDTESDDGALKSMALGLLIPGIIFLIPSGLITLFAPAMLLDIYRGKFWSTQALFIGIEGMVDIGEAERHLFGFNHGRLKWSTNGSTLSRHQYKDGECVALPPLEDNTKKQSSRKETLFTLIDTYAMTATCFYAAKPPSTVIVCGQEGGMQRAVLCSYNWTTQTFVRETVLRVKTLVLDRMFRVDRFRFALRQTQHQEDTHKNGLYNGASIRAVSGGENKMVKPRWALWKIDLILLPILWFISGWVLPPSWPDPDIYALGRPGIARFAGWLAALIPCIQMMLHLQVGHVIGVAAFLYGYCSGDTVAFYSMISLTKSVSPLQLMAQPSFFGK
ncbi:MAG: hypothetical protein M1821_001974 [Bathelium mastoideum]|nr:MAG: hypothetical protein M1821_001974 [Bathelium mastoideum]